MKLKYAPLALALLFFVLPSFAHAGAGGSGTTTQYYGGFPEQTKPATPISGQDFGYDFADPPATDAAFDTYSYTVPYDLAYAWNRWKTGTLFPSSDTQISGYVDGLSAPAVTVNYNVSVSDHDTHAPVAENGTVTVGQKLDFTFSLYGPRDITWFGTGYSMDSPYGEWVKDAAAPARVGNQVTCNAQDFVVSYNVPAYATPIKLDVYIPFSMNPPDRSFTPGANLGSCTGLTSKGDGTVTGAANNGSTLVETCTVTGTGTLSPTFNFNSSYGYFYYRYYDYRDMGAASGGPGCYGNNIAMASYGPPPPTPVPPSNVSSANGPQYDNIPTVKTPYQFVLPAKSMVFSLNAAPAANQAPTVPGLTCPAAATVSQSTSGFSITPSTDADGDTVRYGIDWTGSGTVTEWIPTPGYFASGASSPLLSNISHTAPSSTGPWKVQVLAEDVNAKRSTWTSCTIPVSAAQPDLKPSGSTGASTSGPTKPISFSGTALNNGAGTASNFPNVFQIDNSSQTTRIANVAANTVSSLAPSATAPITATYPSGLPAGSYSVRLCVNMDTSGNIGIAESDTGNNCGSFYPFTVSVPAPPTVSCSVTPSSGYQGDTFTWTATASGGTGAPYTYAWTGPGGLTGKTGTPVARPYSSVGTYTGSVIAKDSGGTPSASTACTSYASANVSACAPTLSPSVQTIDAGAKASFTLGANGTHCNYTPATCKFGDGSAYTSTVYPSATSNYIVNCTGTYGTAPSPPVIVNVRTPDASILANDQTGSTRVNPSTPNNVNLVWNSGNVDRCSITENGTVISPTDKSGSLTRSVTSQTLYKIDCVNSGGVHATDQVVVNVASSFHNF